jgi:hypothetical protein
LLAAVLVATGCGSGHPARNASGETTTTAPVASTDAAAATTIVASSSCTKQSIGNALQNSGLIATGLTFTISKLACLPGWAAAEIVGTGSDSSIDGGIAYLRLSGTEWKALSVGENTGAIYQLGVPQAVVVQLDSSLGQPAPPPPTTTTTAVPSEFAGGPTPAQGTFGHPVTLTDQQGDRVQFTFSQVTFPQVYGYGEEANCDQAGVTAGPPVGYRLEAYDLSVKVLSGQWMPPTGWFYISNPSNLGDLPGDATYMGGTSFGCGLEQAEKAGPGFITASGPPATGWSLIAVPTGEALASVYLLVDASGLNGHEAFVTGFPQG